MVLMREEVSRVLAHLTGAPHLMASLLYGAGLRLMGCVRLRVKDLDFAYHQITVQEAKGAKGRITMLPQAVQKFTGASAAIIPGGTIRTASGGLLVLPPANQGRFTTDWFAVSPELNLTAGMQVTDSIRVSLGYTYLYLNSVIRPGSQVNSVINSGLVPTSSNFGLTSNVTPPPTLIISQPRVFTRQDDFSAHGLTMSVEFRF